VDNGRPHTKEAGMCKLLGSEIASRCIDRALQIHGALGLTRDGHVERGWRDSRINEIFEGTNEIQRIVIASELFSRNRRANSALIRPSAVGRLWPTRPPITDRGQRKEWNTCELWLRSNRCLTRAVSQ
jgi:hypothetical protein